MSMQKCSQCGCDKPLTKEFFYRSRSKLGFHKKCRVCWDAKTKEYNQKHPDIRKALNDRWKSTHKEELWASHILHTHNLTSESYYKLLSEQEGVCAVCLRPPINGERLRVDHDHRCCPSSDKSCGRCVRGLIHHKCNAALGLLNDDPMIFRLAAKYLEYHNVV